MSRDERLAPELVPELWAMLRRVSVFRSAMAAVEPDEKAQFGWTDSMLQQHESLCEAAELALLEAADHLVRLTSLFQQAAATARRGGEGLQ